MARKLCEAMRPSGLQPDVITYAADLGKQEGLDGVGAMQLCEALQCKESCPAGSPSCSVCACDKRLDSLVGLATSSGDATARTQQG